MTASTTLVDVLLFAFRGEMVGPDLMKLCTKLDYKPRGDIGLLRFQNFPPFQDKDRLYYYHIIITESYV